MRSTLAYTTARILLFVAVTGLLYLAGAQGCCSSGRAAGQRHLQLRGAVPAAGRDVRAITSRLQNFRGRLDAGTRAEDDD